MNGRKNRMVYFSRDYEPEARERERVKEGEKGRKKSESSFLGG